MSSLQMRPINSADDRLYSPNGDLAHNFVFLLKYAAYSLDAESLDDVLKDYMKTTGCAEKDLEDVAKSLALYVKEANTPANTTPKEAFEKSGFFNTNKAAQVLFMAKLGQVIACAYFTRTREANDPDQVRLQVDELMKEAEQASKVMM